MSNYPDLDLSELLDAIPIGIFVLRLESRETKEFRNVYINQTNSEIVGIDFKPFVGKTLRETFPASYDHGLPDKYIEALDTGEVVRIGEMVYGDDHVQSKTWLLEVYPLDKNTVILTTENVSELKRAQKDLSASNKSLEAKNNELLELSYFLSHDLKAPLNNILGFAEMINLTDSSAATKELNAKAIGFIQSSAGRMKALIEDVLEFSRIGSTKEQKPIAMNSLVQGVLEDLETEIKLKGATITLAELPVVPGFEFELRQLVLNLLSNGLKFHPKDRAPVISLHAKLVDDYWHFEVKDNGIGIDDADQINIFDSFKRLHRQSEFEGTGIGLANCKKIVELHQGKIWVESVLGEGSTFHFTLPAQKLD